MKEIPVTGGLVALIDDADEGLVHGYVWHAHPDKNTVYARAYIRGSFPAEKRVRMHRLILNAPVGQQVDHINGNGLDNRRCNLRLCTNTQNTRRATKCRWHQGKEPTSKYKGVSWHKDHQKWDAQIRPRTHREHLGSFVSEKDAALAYNQAAIRLYGQFARLNNIMAE